MNSQKTKISSKQKGGGTFKRQKQDSIQKHSKNETKGDKIALSRREGNSHRLIGWSKNQK